MESSSHKLQKKIEEILPLLNLSDEYIAKIAADFLDSILKQLYYSKDVSEIAQSILNIYGGMGTFNDLILFKEEKYLKEEDEKFSQLREELYRLCKDIIFDKKSLNSE